MDITWYGHATFSIDDETRVCFIDPFDLRSVKGKADIVFITHGHYDHCSLDDLKKIMKSDTLIVAAQNCVETRNLQDARIVAPHASFVINGIAVKTIPAYNIKPERLQFHPRANNWVGYVLTAGGKTIYHAGDTDFVPEMRTLGKLDVALLPIGGTYTMDVDEAIGAARTLNAAVTIPMHYRRVLGARAKDAEETFVRNVKGARILEEFE